MANGKLIDASKANIQDICCGYGCTTDLYQVKDWLDALPAVDAVEVVRCKDCRYCYRINSKFYAAYCIKLRFYLEQYKTNVNTHYCAHGERECSE